MARIYLGMVFGGDKPVLAWLYNVAPDKGIDFQRVTHQNLTLSLFELEPGKAELPEK